METKLPAQLSRSDLLGRIPLSGEEGPRGSKAKKGNAKHTKTKIVDIDNEEPQVVDAWAAIRERTYIDGAHEHKILPGIAKKIAKASLLINKTKKLVMERTVSVETEDDLNTPFGELAKRKGMPTKFVAQLEQTGWNCNQVGTLECLGLVDKETIKNLTRSFAESELIRSGYCGHRAKSVSPTNKLHQGSADDQEIPGFGPRSISDLSALCCQPTDLFASTLPSNGGFTPLRQTHRAMTATVFAGLRQTDPAEMDKDASLGEVLKRPIKLRPSTASKENPVQPGANARALLQGLKRHWSECIRSVLDLKLSNTAETQSEKVFCEIVNKTHLQIQRIGASSAMHDNELYKIPLQDLVVDIVQEHSEGYSEKANLNTLKIVVTPLAAARRQSLDLQSKLSTRTASGASRIPSQSAKANKTVVYLQHRDTQLIKKWHDAIKAHANAKHGGSNTFTTNAGAQKTPFQGLLKRNATHASILAPGGSRSSSRASAPLAAEHSQPTFNSLYANTTEHEEPPVPSPLGDARRGRKLEKMMITRTRSRST